MVHSYDRDADETKAWIMEKDTAVSSEDYGHDLASVQALVRRHEGFEVCLPTLCSYINFTVRHDKVLRIVLEDHLFLHQLSLKQNILLPYLL